MKTNAKIKKRSVMKKAQVSGQVLIFVLALIVTAAILLFGYNAIKNIGEQEAKIELIKFQNDFKEKVEDASSSYGSSRRISTIMPKGYDELCLVDKDLKPSNSNIMNKNRIIHDVWNDDASRDNAFLLKTGSLTPKSFYAGNLSVDGDGNGEDDRLDSVGVSASGDLGFLCIKSTDFSLNFIIEGRGRHALIRK